MPDFSFVDLLQLVLLLITCASCYFAGRVHGAFGFAMLLIDNKVIDEKTLEKIRNNILRDDD